MGALIYRICMSSPEKKVTREELYEAVWSKTLKNLAQEWNTTYSRLVQACHEMDIPRPGQGYWQVIALGHTVQKSPLTPRTENIPHELVLLPQGVRPVKIPTAKEIPGVVEAVQKPPEPPEAPRQHKSLSEAADDAILDLLRQARKIDFWAATISETAYPYALKRWVGLDDSSRVTDASLVSALKKVRREYRSFRVEVGESRENYYRSDPPLCITIELRDGFEWKDAWEEAWTFADNPNPFSLSDNALRLYTWSKGPKNTGVMMKRQKVGAQARLRKSYSDIEDHLREIRLKAAPSIQWENGGGGHWGELRVWYENKDVVYYYHGPLNPSLGLNIAEVNHAELERFQNWLYGEILKPGFPEGKEPVGIYDIRDRKTLKRIFNRLPRDVGRYSSMPGFFNAIRLMDGMGIRHSFEDGAGPWLVVCQLEEGHTWREIKARLMAKAKEIPLEKRYQLSADGRALLRWILGLRKDEFLQQMTPPVEERMKTEIGFQAGWDKNNFRAYLELLLEEINEKTEFKLRAINWKTYSDVLTRIQVKTKEADLDEVVRAVQVFGLRRDKILDGDKVRTAIIGLLE
jgi:hypothetical protein